MGLDISLRYSSKVDEMGSYAAPDHFEFITSAELQSDLCPAADIFVSGKLLPSKHQSVVHTFPALQIDGREKGDVHHKCSESSFEQKAPFKRQVVRNYSWKSDGSSVSSSSTMVPDLERNYSYKSDGTSLGYPKIRWQCLISGMGMVKFPLEMELRDLKHRQYRCKRPASLFPATADTAGRGRGSSWGLIKALSCKDHTSTSVSASSLIFMPSVRS